MRVLGDSGRPRSDTCVLSLLANHRVDSETGGQREEHARRNRRGVSLPPIFRRKKGRQVRRPFLLARLGCFLSNLDGGLCRFLRFRLGRELLLDLRGDGLCVYLVRCGRIFEDGGGIAA